MEENKLYGNIDIITGKLTSLGTYEECNAEKLRNSVIYTMRESYDNIIEILKQYLDLKEEYYSIITLWIIGTYIHNEFDSYPYLFFNAMRGSGKSRALRLICSLSKDGNVMASPTEAVLFRVKGTLGIDEFEGVAQKDKAAIRELLNGAYKKGIKIFRMKKKKILGQEELVAEEFNPYRPIVMANIYGMDEVLGDRCLTLILEKSNNPLKTRLIEDFQNNENIKKIIQMLNQCSLLQNNYTNPKNNYTNLITSNLGTLDVNEQSQCSLCSYILPKNIYKNWNNYIIDRYKTTLTTLHTYNTLTTLTTQNIILDQLFNKIYDTNIIGRNLELFIPIFFLADLISDEVFDSILKIAKEITREKKHDEEIESIDVMVYDYISRKENPLEYYSIKNLVNEFRNFSNEDYEWLNFKWFGRALKRLNLILEKRRRGSGIEVILNIKKAQEKLKIFRSEEK